MECFLLGSGGMMPMPQRLLTSVAVRLGGSLVIFDAGEGAQLGLKRLKLGVRGFRLLAVTHLHADHCLGLPGLMMMKAQMEDPEPLTLLGPPGLGDFVVCLRKTIGFFTNYEVRCIEWAPESGDLAYADEQFSIFWKPLVHTTFCLGYRMEERDRPGKFDRVLAEAMDIPAGPLRGRLQAGESVVLPSGRTVTPSEVLGPPRPGRRLAYVVDTRPTEAARWLCREADLAFIEGMFLPEDVRHAEEKGHLTVVEAARIAVGAGVARAVWVHISPRYAEGDLVRLEEAGHGHFMASEAGRDFASYRVAYQD